MYLILAKHTEEGRAFAFKVSKDLARYIKKGMAVLVETCKGLDIAFCQTEPFTGPGSFDAVKMFGAYEPIKPVIGIVNATVYNHVAKDIAKRGSVVIERAYLEIEDKDYEACPF